MSAERSDVLVFRVVERLDDGRRLRVVFARIGPQRYQDGVVVRSPDDLFAKSTIKSLVGAPVKLNHGGPTVGKVLDAAPAGGTHLAGTVEIDEEHVAAVNAAPPFLSGEWRGVYSPPDPALADVFGAHDFVARQIQFTAMAVGVGAPRCGESCARGSTARDTWRRSLQRQRRRRSKPWERRTHRRRSPSSSASSERRKRRTLGSPQRRVRGATRTEIAAAARRRAALILQARELGLSANEHIDELSDIAIKRLVVAKTRKSLRLDAGASDAFIEGAFGAIVVWSCRPSAVDLARETVIDANMSTDAALDPDGFDGVDARTIYTLARQKAAFLPRGVQTAEKDATKEPAADNVVDSPEAARRAHACESHRHVPEASEGEVKAHVGSSRSCSSRAAMAVRRRCMPWPTRRSALRTCASTP